MPHVVVTRAAALAEAVTRFEPIRENRDGIIVKSDQAFLEREGRCALFPALTVAGPLRQRFFILATEREDGVAVRLEPTTDPEKTPAVHLALALVADWLRRQSPDATFGATNIAPTLERL